MFQKLCVVIILFIVALGGASGAGLPAPETGIDEAVARRLLLVVDEPGDNDSRQRLLQAVNSVSPAGVIFKKGIESSLLSQYISQVRGASKAQLLVGLDLRTATATDHVKTGFTAPLNVLATVQDTSLVAQVAARDGRMLLEAGVDFLFFDPVQLSASGFGTDPSVVHRTSRLYIEGLQRSGVDVVATASEKNGRPTEEALDLLKELGLKGLDIYSLVDTNANANLTTEYEVADYLEKQHQWLPLTVTRLPQGKLLEKDLKKPAADFLIVENLQDLNGLGMLPERKLNRKRQERVADKIADWKVERLVAINMAEESSATEGDSELRLLHALSTGASALLSNHANAVPIADLGRASFATASVGLGSSDFSDYLAKYASVISFDLGPNFERLTEHLPTVDHFSHFVVAVDLPWFDQLPDERRLQFLNFLEELQRRRTLVIVSMFGASDRLDFFQSIAHVTYHPVGNAMAQSLAPQLLFGALPFTAEWAGGCGAFEQSYGTQPLGRLRYADPQLAGRSQRKLLEIDSIVNRAILSQATPGCQVVVARRGEVLYEKAFGHLSYDSLMPVTTETVYDLASLTKVGATLQMLMRLVEEKKVNIDHTLGEYLPEAMGTNKEHLLIRDVLLHQAGLKPYIPFWELTYHNRKKRILDPQIFSQAEGEEFSMEVLPGMYSTPAIRDSVWRWVLQSDLMTLRPGDAGYRYKYSDLGFMILQRLAEAVAGTSLDEYVAEVFYKPLGLDRLCFQPLCHTPYSMIAPTELDYYFRNDLVWGTVHDQNAAVMGGVAGHAGLFGNARSLAVLMQMQLQGGYYGGNRFFEPETVEMFTRRVSHDAQRALGWDLKDLTFKRNNTSFWSSETTYGHTGFTGTAVWVDPATELIYVFLSNRVHPDAGNYKLVESNVRTRIQDVIYQSLGWELTSGD